VQALGGRRVGRLLLRQIGARDEREHAAVARIVVQHCATRSCAAALAL
jgi:hypothetical protein